MCKKIVCLMSLVVLLGLASSSPAELVVHWALEEGSGTTATDSSGNGNDGTFVNSPEWVEGRFGGGLHFSGDADTKSVSYSLPGGATVWETGTVALWVKLDSLGQDVWSSCFTNHNPNSAGIQFDVDGGDPGSFRLNPGGQFFGPATTEWTHLALTFEAGDATLYYNGEEAVTAAMSDSQRTFNVFAIGTNRNLNNWMACTIDELRVYDHPLTGEEIRTIMLSSAGRLPRARRPVPADGELHEDTWVIISWSPGDFAVSHDVYLGDSFDDVNNGTGDTYRGNQTSTMITVGFPGFVYPDGLVPGTTYYWRIDEVNDSEPNSPWKGDIWSFSIPPKTAYNPDPVDGGEFVATDATLSWTPGFGAKLHTVYIGTDYDTVDNAAGGLPQGTATYTPSAPLEDEKVYYWRVDEFDALDTYKGDVWTFTTPGAAGSPSPANRATGVQMTAILSWTPAATAISHDVYFGTDKDAVMNATTASPEYKGNKASGAESYDPGKLAWNSDYYWRVDAVYSTGTVKGLVWNFATADFITVDDFESYNDIDPPDPNSNRIFDIWIDGFGTTDNGALVGNDLPPYAEQTVVHGGAQCMPYRYDNTNKTSEATLTLVYPRDWTEEGVTKLSLWFRGARTNATDKMYIALNGNAVVYHDETTATQKSGWNQWVVGLQAFADQGVNLANANTITIGIGTKGSPAAGGTGTMYFDDIRLIR